MIRIVFVDDDSGVLNAMRRSFHSMRSEWSVEFVAGGIDALAALERQPADVIVSDMRMPGMDGWQLLGEVRNRYPSTVRLLLSGHADPASIMRSVNTAHQYLAKPCDSATLKAAITQTQAIRSLLSSARLAALVGRIGMLPSAPVTFQKLLQCLQLPTSSIADVAHIIDGDVAMTANIMKLVHSAFFGSRQPISTTERAVAYLGLDTVGALVLGHNALGGGAADESRGFSHQRLWQHSLQTATAARAIALHEGLPTAKADEAFLAGVLHDVGKVVFAAVPAVRETPALSPEEAHLDAQRHHAEVGAYLLGLWGFPTPIVEAVAFHHQPSRGAGGGIGLAGIVHVADWLAHRMKAGGGPFDLVLEPGFLESRGLAGQLPQWIYALDALHSNSTTSEKFQR